MTATWDPKLHPRDRLGRFSTLFHVTSRRHRESIAKHGLVPGADMITAYNRPLPLPSEEFVPPQDRWDYNLWLFNTEQAAREAQQQLWGGSKGPGELDIYEVQVPTEEVLPDRDKWPNSVMTKGRVTPDKLRRLGGFNHVPGVFEVDPPGEYVYHVAEDDNLASIEEVGLEPRTTSMVNEADYPGVYFWSDLRDARSWQRDGQSVLRVRKSDLNLEPDLSGSSLDIQGKAFRSRQGVPPESITVEDMPGGMNAAQLLDLYTDVSEDQREERMAALFNQDQITTFPWMAESKYTLRDYGSPETLAAARWLARQGFVPKFYEWNPAMHPRDALGRFMPRSVFDKSLTDDANRLDLALGDPTVGMSPVERAREWTRRLEPHAPVHLRVRAHEFLASTEHHLDPEELTHNAKFFSELMQWAIENLEHLLAVMQVTATTMFAFDPTLHPRYARAASGGRGGEFMPKGISVAPLLFETMNSLLDEVDKWPRVSPEEGGASPRFYGAQALMESRSQGEVIVARDDDGKLVGVGTFTDHVSGHGPSGMVSSGPIEGGTFAAIEGGGLPLFRGFLRTAADRGQGVTFVAGNARAEKLYDKLGVPKVAKGNKKGEGAVYELSFAQVLELTRDLRALARAFGEDERDYEFDPHQPRDRYGRWTRTGASVIAPWKEIVGKKLSFSASEVTMGNLTEDEQARIRATWEKQTGVPAAKIAVNVRDVFRSAEGTPEWEAGLTWYEDAHGFARQRAETHDLSVETTAGVVSALSPMTEWNTNKHQADLMFQFYSRDPEHFRSLLPQQAAHEVLAWAKERGEKWPLGAGRRNIVNASRLIQGATPEEVLPQAKTRGFYNSIVEPNNPWDVVVDSHMINVAYGGMTPGAQGLLIEVSKPGSADVWGDVVTPEGAEYTARPPFSWFGSPKVRGRDVGVIPLIADAVREAAAEWNQEHPDQQLSPMQVQAITWVQWLKLHPAQEKRKAVKESQRATVAALRLAGATA